MKNRRLGFRMVLGLLLLPCLVIAGDKNTVVAYCSMAQKA